MIFNLISAAEPAQPPSFFSPFNYSFERIVTRSAPAVESGPDLWHRPSLNLLMVRRNRPRWTSSQDSPNSTTLVEPVGCCLPQVSTPNQIEFSHLRAGMQEFWVKQEKRRNLSVEVDHGSYWASHTDSTYLPIHSKCIASSADSESVWETENEVDGPDRDSRDHWGCSDSRLRKVVCAEGNYKSKRLCFWAHHRSIDNR